ncbi:calcium load-activated calcium channel isoform X2 [Adelges cooleyi]|uniref:calcium load-activated calcium channel isoform X2 n=1 Tax=Adelges cooleyi TaxID=133065 RepID=UPI0021807628|nr:calcium load-activated calcium channel isoform X2 [Adelges cooleyi]
MPTSERLHAKIRFPGLTWLLVYRTEKYQKLKTEIEKSSKKLEKRKEAHGDSVDKQQKKKIERVEEKLKINNRDLSMVKMKSMFAIGFAFTALLSMFNSIFDGRVVARLPFTPIHWVQGLSHRNLPGDNFTECSFIFLYVLCTMSIRQNIQKILGFAPSRMASKQSGGLFGPQPQQFK